MKYFFPDRGETVADAVTLKTGRDIKWNSAQYASEVARIEYRKSTFKNDDYEEPMILNVSVVLDDKSVKKFMVRRILVPQYLTEELE